jgi:hypothetical protein
MTGMTQPANKPCRSSQVKHFTQPAGVYHNLRYTLAGRVILLVLHTHRSSMCDLQVRLCTRNPRKSSMFDMWGIHVFNLWFSLAGLHLGGQVIWLVCVFNCHASLAGQTTTRTHLTCVWCIVMSWLVLYTLVGSRLVLQARPNQNPAQVLPQTYCSKSIWNCVI